MAVQLLGTSIYLVRVAFKRFCSADQLLYIYLISQLLLPISCIYDFMYTPATEGGDARLISENSRSRKSRLGQRVHVREPHFAEFPNFARSSGNPRDARNK